MAIRYGRPVLALVLLLVAACNQGEQMKSGDITSLVLAERSFAANARSQGIGPSFMGVLDVSAVVFQPGPVNGRETYKDVTPSPAILAWQPVYAEIAISGDLGYTTGPWEYFADSANAEPVAFGEYISVWRWDTSGTWKLALDIGTFRDRQAVDSTLHTQTPAESGNTGQVTSDDLMMRDRALAARASTDERAVVYAEVLAEDARLMRTGHCPKVGQDDIMSWLAAEMLTESTFPEKAFLSADGSLGYVYGRAEVTAGPADTAQAIAHGGYTRIWRRVGDRWKLALDVLSVRPGDLSKVVAPESN
jgi:ketosteroid isomerase-like protein